MTLSCPGRPGREVGVEGEVEDGPTRARAEGDEEGFLVPPKDPGGPPGGRHASPALRDDGGAPAPVRVPLPREAGRRIEAPEATVLVDRPGAPIRELRGHLARA